MSREGEVLASVPSKPGLVIHASVVLPRGDRLNATLRQRVDDAHTIKETIKDALVTRQGQPTAFL
jgi:hypothetical protein